MGKDIPSVDCFVKLLDRAAKLDGATPEQHHCGKYNVIAYYNEADGPTVLVDLDTVPTYGFSSEDIVISRAKNQALIYSEDGARQLVEFLRTGEIKPIAA